jgi:hypothetical protein
MSRNRPPFLFIVILFVLLNALFISAKNIFTRNGLDQEVLIIGNLILFIITFFSIWINLRNISNSNPQALIRSIYLSTMVKLFVCAIAAFIYIIQFRDSLNKPSLFVCMGLYVLYTIIEVSVLTRILRGKKNA